MDSDAAGDKAADKAALRRDLRNLRRAHVEALDPRVKALLFNRPPSALSALIPQGAVIGLYSATAAEAPASGYARFFHEAGHPLALPAFTSRADPMTFRLWTSPYIDEGLNRDRSACPSPLPIPIWSNPTSYSCRLWVLRPKAHVWAKAADITTAGLSATRTFVPLVLRGTASCSTRCPMRRMTAR